MLSALNNSPLPPRVAWFAPWRWKRWTRWVLLGLLLAAYVEFPVLIVPVLEQRPNALPPQVAASLRMFWFPLEWAYHQSEFVKAFYDRQFEAVKSLLDMA